MKSARMLVIVMLAMGLMMLNGCRWWFPPAPPVPPGAPKLPPPPPIPVP